MQQNFKGANFNIYFVHRAGYEVVNLVANKEKVQLILFQHCIASYRKNRVSISSPSHCLVQPESNKSHIRSYSLFTNTHIAPNCSYKQKDDISVERH